MKTSVILLSILVMTGCVGRDVATVIDPFEAPPVNKRVTKPIIFKKKKRVMIAVIDTGLAPELMDKNWVCPTGHKDFTGGGLKDNHGHGTHISGIVDQYAKNYIFAGNKNFRDIDNVDTEYCQIIIKYYDPKIPNLNNLKNTIASFRWAIDQKVDIINYSGGGTSADDDEKALILEALSKGIKVVAAAGNERSDIDKNKYYPAMYDSRIIVVGNLVNSSRTIATSSNFGKSVNTWELGTSIMSRLPGDSFGYMTGTSQATAIKSGKLVREMLSTK